MIAYTTRALFSVCIFSCPEEFEKAIAENNIWTVSAKKKEGSADVYIFDLADAPRVRSILDKGEDQSRKSYARNATFNSEGNTRKSSSRVGLKSKIT